MATGAAQQGLLSSFTVTAAIHVCILLSGSVAVNVTLFVPKLSQSKVVGGIEIETLQLSLLPLSICAAVSVALPFSSSCTSMF